MTTIQILCDNNIEGVDFLGEHGFAAHVIHPTGKLLFDTGQGHTLAHNQKTSGVCLTNIGAVVLSHGHYDHTGGLAWVLEQTGPIAVHAHPAMFSRHLARAAGATRFVGCPLKREELEAAGARFSFHTETNEIASGVWFITGYDRRADQTPEDSKLLLDDADGPVPDPMADDASLLLQTASGPVLLLGCAHGGVLNILDHVRAHLGIQRLHAVLGGTHLMFFAPAQVGMVIEAFEALDVGLVGVSHCTGDKAAIQLAQHFGGRYRRAAAGSTFRF